jgi:hypothetical protein
MSIKKRQRDIKIHTLTDQLLYGIRIQVAYVNDVGMTTAIAQCDCIGNSDVPKER